MQNQKSIIAFSAVSLIIGILIGQNISFGGNRTDFSKNMKHEMPDGHMMDNVSMDMEDMMEGMTASLAGKTGDAFDQEFLYEMIMHHQGAVEMARMVLATSKRPELLKLASDIISAQMKEIKMMEDWEKAWFK